MKTKTKNNRQKMVILQGVPASGKTTWAREFTKKKKNWVIVSRDALEEASGGCKGVNQNGYVNQLVKFSIMSAFERGLNVIIDGMNLDGDEVKLLQDIAKDYGAEVERREFRISLPDALERNAKRTDKHISADKIRELYREYIPEEYKYYNTDHRRIMNPNPDLPPAVICDIDGTVALRNGRYVFDNQKAIEDTFDPRMKRLLTLLEKSGVEVIFLSGREETEECREVTERWLAIHGFGHCKLFMRPKGDGRGDEDVKYNLWHTLVAPNYDVVAVFDDRDCVVEMWRSLGLLCNQVYYGNF